MFFWRSRKGYYLFLIGLSAVLWEVTRRTQQPKEAITVCLICGVLSLFLYVRESFLEGLFDPFFDRLRNGRRVLKTASKKSKGG